MCFPQSWQLVIDNALTILEAQFCIRSLRHVSSLLLTAKFKTKAFLYFEFKSHPSDSHGGSLTLFTCGVLAYRGHTGTLKLDKLINGPKQNQFGNQVSFHKNYRVNPSSSGFSLIISCDDRCSVKHRSKTGCFSFFYRPNLFQVMLLNY